MKHTCPYCGLRFSGRTDQTFCNRTCSNKSRVKKGE